MSEYNNEASYLSEYTMSVPIVFDLAEQSPGISMTCMFQNFLNKILDKKPR